MINFGLQRFNQRRMGWTLGIVTSAVLALALVLLFLLTQATQKWELYEQNYELLFTLNSVVAVALMLVIGWASYRLVQRLRAGKFGSRLLLKLAGVFALIGIVPGILIYTVSYQFVSRSIESWFDVKVEGALDAGLNLGRASIDNISQELSIKVRAAATSLSSSTDTALVPSLEKIRELTNAEDVVLWSQDLKPLASVGASKYELFPEPPYAIEMKGVNTEGFTWRVEGLEEGATGTANAPRVKVLVRVVVNKIRLRPEQLLLQVTQKLPSNLVNNALAVLEANREYQERALARDGLKRMYIGTLTLTLFLAVFGAVLLAAILGNQLAKPLLVLALGVRDVAAGDLSPKEVLDGRDELDGLTRAFADMTEQLANSRSAVQSSMDQLSLARANLQTILDNLTAGVILMKPNGVILLANPGANRILKVDLNTFIGRNIHDIRPIQSFAKPLTQFFENFLADMQSGGSDHWQESFEFSPLSKEEIMALGTGELAQWGSNLSYNQSVLAMGHTNTNAGTGENESSLTLVARGAVLPNSDWLIVFDDISQIVSAQRTQAWGEVAKRLAHEIKNPLTPIQLSAERLGVKLKDKVSETDQVLLSKSVKTIVDQVDAMKRLVNEFREFGRMPQANLAPVDLNGLIKDVLSLYEVENDRVVLKSEFDAKCPLIMGDEQLLRQVIHNLLQNAQDASEGAQFPCVTIQTQWRERSNRVRMSVTDNGAGFAYAVLSRAFEPYVTTKIKGTGLGLAVVKKIADEHNARIDLRNMEENGVVLGAKVSLSFQAQNVANLSMTNQEKA
jgi:nitrogen fixation/metabolism regulation signal transduction histidine kinase